MKSELPWIESITKRRRLNIPLKTNSQLKSICKTWSEYPFIHSLSVVTDIPCFQIAVSIHILLIYYHRSRNRGACAPNILMGRPAPQYSCYIVACIIKKTGVKAPDRPCKQTTSIASTIHKKHITRLRRQWITSTLLIISPKCQQLNLKGYI